MGRQLLRLVAVLMGVQAHYMGLRRVVLGVKLGMRRVGLHNIVRLRALGGHGHPRWLAHVDRRSVLRYPIYRQVRSRDMGFDFGYSMANRGNRGRTCL